MAKKMREPRLKSISITNKKQSLDTGTGELNTILSESSFKTPVEPNFVKMYLEDIAKLYQCTRPEIDVLFEILKIMDYSNIASLPLGRKQTIAENLYLKSINWVNLCLIQLMKKGIMTKQGSGVYLVNPLLFAKGTWKDIREIEFTAVYTEKGGRIIKTEKK
jgi:hypothetical protein